MDILSRIMAIASLFFVLVVGVQVYPMDPASQDVPTVTMYLGRQPNNPFERYWGMAPRDICITLSSENEPCIGGIVYQVKPDKSQGAIWMLHIHPKYRGRGYATELLKTAIDHMERFGVNKITLSALPDEEISKEGLVRLYKRVGFQVDEVQKDPVLVDMTLYCSPVMRHDLACEFLTKELLIDGEIYQDTTATQDGQKVGAVMYTVNANESEICVLEIEPAYQNKGFGHILLNKALDDLRSCGCARVSLVAMPLEGCHTEEERRSGRLRLKKFYEKFGFQAYGDVSGRCPIAMVKYL